MKRDVKIRIKEFKDVCSLTVLRIWVFVNNLKELFIWARAGPVTGMNYATKIVSGP